MLILIDIIILAAIGLPIALLCRRWQAWINRGPRTLRPFRAARRFGLRSWAARSFVLDTPPERVKERIDDLPEMSYADAAALIAARGRTASFMALAPLAGKQVFETGIETDWIAPDTVEIRAHSYADWPLNALDDAELPAKQYQMMFERAIVRVERHGENRARVSCELETPVWAWMLSGAIALLVGWAAWMVWRSLSPGAGAERANTAIMAALTAWTATRVTELLRLQSIALMDSVVRTFGTPCADDE